MPRQPRALLELRKGIGVLLQGNGLLTDLTVAENVALPLRAHTRLPEPVLRRLVEMKLDAVGLRAAADLFPRELSGGMARRVALARALALDPPLMLYDEPLTGLDPIASGVIMSLLRRLNADPGPDLHRGQPPRARDPAGLPTRRWSSPTAPSCSTAPPMRCRPAPTRCCGSSCDGAPDGPIAFESAPRQEAA